MPALVFWPFGIVLNTGSTILSALHQKNPKKRLLALKNSSLINNKEIFSATPFSFNSTQLGAFSTYTSSLAIIAFGVIMITRRWKISEWAYFIFAVISLIGYELTFAFAKSEGVNLL